MNNACPSCGTTYQVQPKNVGRHIKCKICGTALFVGEDGIRLDELASGPSSEPEPFGELTDPGTLTPRPSRAGRLRNPGAGDMAARLAQSLGQLPDPITWLFGAALLGMLISWFLPLIDSAAVASKQATLAMGEQREQRLADQFLKNKEQKKTTPADEELRNKNRENWDKERRDLQAAIDDMKLGHERWQYWYQWGMLGSFMLLALASLGYLQPSQPLIRRVVGAIVVVAMVILVFMLFLGARGLR
ncbi:MAG TPA: hypothetical protein PKD86_07315 [Gemmatales bacterium]|nr:hypothetical protein [Gemmatales bacterium]HMP59145.1 hypothetical protein [Gemmatales bacterium]